MGVVITIFFVIAARYIFGHPHDGSAFFTRPFYDPQLWNSKAVLGGTSIAVLSYIGFDGISTLSEEAENPRRNILLATVLTCFVIGVLSALEVYARAIALAGDRSRFRTGHRVHFRRRPRLEAHVRNSRFHAAGGELRFRHGRADRRRAPAVRDGTQQGSSAEAFFGMVDAEAARAAEQRPFCRRHCSGRRAVSHLRIFSATDSAPRC